MSGALAQAGAPVAAAGVALAMLAGHRLLRLAGLVLALVGLALLAPILAPSGHGVALALAALAGVLGALVLAVVFRRWPWVLALAALAASAARIPVELEETANLLIPLYGVIAASALALAWSLWHDPPRRRELGPLAWPLALLVLWLGTSLLWSEDVRAGALELFFFVVPFALLATALARLAWSDRWLAALFALLSLMALAFAAVGVWQWLTRDVFWNPKVIVGNAYAPFYRVNSVFWDPSIYGRFLVVAILAALVPVLFPVRRRLLAYGLFLLIAVLWLGLLVSFSQSSFAALVAAVVVACVLAWRRRALIAVALALCAVVPVGVAAPQLHSLRDGLFESSRAGLNKATSGRSRLVLNGIRIALDHPLAGVGVGGFQEAYARRLHHRQPPAAASHNTPVTVAAELGLVGLGLFAWLLAVVASTAFRQGSLLPLSAGRAASAAGLALVAIFVHSLFYNAFFEDPMAWGLLGLVALAGQARASEKETAAASSPTEPRSQ